MGQIAALLLDPRVRARLSAALKPDSALRVEHQVTLAEAWPDLYAVAHKKPLHVLIFDPYLLGAFDAGSCTDFHRRFPSVVLLPYTRFSGHPVNDVLQLAALGVRRVVCRDEDDGPPRFRAILRAAVSDACVVRIAAELEDVLSPELSAFLHHLASQAGPSFGPDEAARVHFCHPKTLRQRLRAASLPSTNKLIVWARLLHAACLLEDPGRSVESVALVLGFPSTSALHKQMRRYMGVGPREVAAQGGLTYAAAEFRVRLRGGNWDLPAPAAA
jgi:AraC-like DNA-binding protein